MKLKIKSRFWITPNELLQDENISWKAKGLYWYLQSKPDDWDFSAEKISREAKDGLDSTKSGLQELEKAWYLERKKFKNKKGQWEVEYILFDTPFDWKKEETRVENPLWENTKTRVENPPVENPPTIKKIIYNKKNNISKDILSKKENFFWNSKNNFSDLLKKEITENEEVKQKIKTKFSLQEESFKSSAADFFDYWTEKSLNWKKERWQMQKTFDIVKRFNTWLRHTQEWSFWRSKTRPKMSYETEEEFVF